VHTAVVAPDEVIVRPDVVFPPSVLADQLSQLPNGSCPAYRPE
jgi:hypothetical protein